MGKGGGDGTFPRYRPPRPRAGRAPVNRESEVRSSEKFGGNATTDAVDGLQFPTVSLASQSQNPAGSSVGVEAGQDTELAAKSGVLDEVRKISGQATERAKSGVPNPDSEGLGGVNEGSEEALVVQLYEAFHGLEELDRAAGVFQGVKRTCIGFVLRIVRSLDYNLRQKLCEYFLPNGEKAGESSNASHAKRKKLWASKNFPGVRERNNRFGSGIWRRVPKEYIWLGTFETREAAAQARGAAANWLATHSGSKLLNKKELGEVKECAIKAVEHLSDDRSHHNVALPDLVENLEEEATTSASLVGKAVASEEQVSQRDSPADENFSSEKLVNQWDFPTLEDFLPEIDLDNHSPELDLNDRFQYWK